MILELGAGADILRGIGVLYWLLAPVVIVIALCVRGRWRIKLPVAHAVLGLFDYSPYQATKKSRAVKSAFMPRYEPAKALFDKLCKGAKRGRRFTAQWITWRGFG
jgi:hypothetical protein